VATLVAVQARHLLIPGAGLRRVDGTVIPVVASTACRVVQGAFDAILCRAPVRHHLIGRRGGEVVAVEKAVRPNTILGVPGEHV